MSTSASSCAPRRSARGLAFGGTLALLAGAVLAQPAPATPAGAIYTCTTPDGRRLTSDRPLAECKNVEQRILNRDGSLLRVQPPTPTAEEYAARDAEQRRKEAQLQAQQDAVRRDRNLMQRYPDEASHRRAREGALASTRLALTSAEQRLEELQRLRQPLIAETEFYKGRSLPDKLRQQLDANEAATAAQRSAIETHRAELARVNGLYDAELDRLRRLWAGAAPGSLGPISSSAIVPVAADKRSTNATPR